MSPLAILWCLLITTLSSQTTAKPPSPHTMPASPATPCQFPSVVHITLETDDGMTECSGILISKNHVLTAAHCFPANQYIYGSYINVGTINRTDDGRYTNSIKNFAIHTYYSRNPMRNDIALISLEKQVKYNSCVKAASLPKKAETFTNKRCIAAGWGQIGASSPSSEKLLHVTMPVRDHSECTAKMSHASLNDQHICVGDFMTCASTCLGDSGGPLYCPSSNGKMVLAGISSFGCRYDAAIFTNVAHYKTWIRSLIRIL